MLTENGSTSAKSVHNVEKVRKNFQKKFATDTAVSRVLTKNALKIAPNYGKMNM